MNKVFVETILDPNKAMPPGPGKYELPKTFGKGGLYYTMRSQSNTDKCTQFICNKFSEAAEGRKDSWSRVLQSAGYSSSESFRRKYILSESLS